MNIYVASSWRNSLQPEVVRLLREWGHQVYDFRERGFAWSAIDPDWQQWSPAEFRERLRDKRAWIGCIRDYNAMHAADVCVLVLPCGRSAHLEIGWAVGARKLTFVLMLERQEPELMYMLCTQILVSIEELREAVGEVRSQALQR